MEKMLQQCIKITRTLEGRVKTETEKTLEKQLLDDMLEFCIWLSFVDGDLGTQELQTMAKLLGAHFDDKVNPLIEKYKNSDNRFYFEVPHIFDVFIKIAYFSEASSISFKNLL